MSIKAQIRSMEQNWSLVVTKLVVTKMVDFVTKLVFGTKMVEVVTKLDVVTILVGYRYWNINGKNYKKWSVDCYKNGLNKFGQFWIMDIPFHLA